jgi:hypothetical protein
LDQLNFLDLFDAISYLIKKIKDKKLNEMLFVLDQNETSPQQVIISI